jgi:hypothetical protein
MEFLAMTGNVKFIDPFEVIVRKLQASGDILLWGPEAKMVQIALMTAWASNAKGLMDEIIEGFNLKGDVTVDEPYIQDAFIEYINVGQWAYDDARPKVLQSLAQCQSRSLDYFKSKRQKGQFDEFLEEYLNAMDTHLQAYMAEYPLEVLLPEVEKVIKLAEMPPGTRNIDIVTLQDRVRALRELPGRQLGLTSDIEAGRLWQHAGIMYGSETNATTYQVLAERDRVTCPVCQKLDGTTYSIPRQIEKIEQFVEYAGDPGAIAELYRFPRYADIDNRSPAELLDMDLIPPFHGNCRCELSIIY